MYLSNAEREALMLTGYTDPEPWMVAQAIDQARLVGTYIPGEESLLLRLADAEEYEARMQGQRDTVIEEAAAAAALEPQEEAPAAEEAESPAEEAPVAAAAEEVADPVEPAVLELARLDGSDAVPFEPGPDPVLDQDFASFTKAQLIDFAFEQFGKTLDPALRKDSLIAEVQALVDAGA